MKNTQRGLARLDRVSTGWQVILCDSSRALLSTIASASLAASQASYSNPTGVSWLGSDKHSEITPYTAQQRGTRQWLQKTESALCVVLRSFWDGVKLKVLP